MGTSTPITCRSWENNGPICKTRLSGLLKGSKSELYQTHLVFGTPIHSSKSLSNTRIFNEKKINLYIFSGITREGITAFADTQDGRTKQKHKPYGRDRNK